MIYLEDLVVAKEQNEKTIVELEQKIVELSTENRVFDKLIALEKSRQDCGEENI